MKVDYDLVEVIRASEQKTLSIVKDRHSGVRYIERHLYHQDSLVYRQLQYVHQGIPEIIDIEQHGDEVIILEEYIDSPTLAQYRTLYGLEESDILNIMMQLLDLLAIVHHMTPPIIHRDIKPENVFYDGDRVKLFDFDIARNLKDNASHDTVVMGSIGYAAPEQFGFGQSDHRVDIYAMGILLNYMLTGDIPSVSLSKGKFNPIILKATAISPDDRYSTAEFMKNDLKRFLPVSDQIKIEKPVNPYPYALDWTPVGFRSRKIWKMVIATLIYPYMAYSFFTTPSDSSTDLIGHISLSILTYFLFLGIVAVVFNYRDIRHRNFLGRHSTNKKTQIIGASIVVFAFIVFLIIVDVVIEAIIRGIIGLFV